MWNSPSDEFGEGRQYRIEEISALLYPLEMFLDEIREFPVENVVSEAILEPLEKDELKYALFQVLQALLEDVEIPEGGHTGIQQAIVAELLAKVHADVEAEIIFNEGAISARMAAWQSIDRLLIQSDPDTRGFPMILEELGFSPDDPKIYESEKLTSPVWEELLRGESYLMSEFLEDEDWKMGFLMDLPPDQAEGMSEVLGLNLESVQALAHTPSDAEMREAEEYFARVIAMRDALG
ncbi:MAG: hypothetical protein AAGC68_07070 [Verrucomicrobiota bacterium]